MKKLTLGQTEALIDAAAKYNGPRSQTLVAAVSKLKEGAESMKPRIARRRAQKRKQFFCATCQAELTVTDFATHRCTQCGKPVL